MNENNLRGVFRGTTLLQSSGVIGGARSVFVPIQGIKDDLVYPTNGGQLKNPFPGPAKFYAGDLMEYRTNERGESPEIYLLKTYKVAADSTGTEISIVRDGYKHIPFIGDKLGVAPATIGGDITTVLTVTGVEETTANGQNIWKITVSAPEGGQTSVSQGDILVEADANNKMLIKKINAVADSDYDCFHYPATSSNPNGARYYLTPIMRGTMYIHRMSPMPQCVLDLNQANVTGWFRVNAIDSLHN